MWLSKLNYLDTYYEPRPSQRRCLSRRGAGEPLARECAQSRPAISKHLRVLRALGREPRDFADLPAAHRRHGASEARVLDNIDPLAKLAAKR